MPWTEPYYSALEHILWEPQRYGLRHDPDPAKRLGVYKAMKRARTKEKPLNDILEVFFALAPSSFTSHFFGGDRAQPLTSVNAKDLAVCQTNPKSVYGNLCQPDLFFVAPGLRLAVEMKVADGKPRLEQVLKYAALLHTYPHESSAGRRRLVFMGETDFAGFWAADGLKTEADLRTALAAFNEPKRAEQFARYGLSLEDAKRWSGTMEVAFVSYRELLAVLQEAARPLAGASAGEEVYDKLIKGLHFELTNRFNLA
jgi:hypothetical protein